MISRNLMIVLLVATVATGGIVGSTSGASIAVTNPNFETGDLSGWTAVGAGVANFWFSSFLINQQSPYGDYLPFMANDSGLRYIQQQLPDLYQPNTTYTLTVGSVHRNDIPLNTPSDFGVRFKNTGGLTLEDTTWLTSGYAKSSVWQDMTVTFTTPAADGPIGTPIVIEMFQDNNGYDGTNATYTQWLVDGVRLTAESVAIPEPSSMLLLIAGLAGCMVFRRRTG